MTEDEKLVQDSLEGDEEAFRLLVEKYKGMAASLAYNIVRNSETTKDLVQEAFIRAYQSLPKLKDKAKFNSWFYGIVKRTCIYWLRRKKNIEVSYETEDNLIDKHVSSNNPNDDPANKFEGKENYALLEKVLQSIPPKYRETIILKHVENLSYAEIGKRLGISRSGVEARLRRSRAIIRQRLVDFVGADADLFMDEIEEKEQQPDDSD